MVWLYMLWSLPCCVIPTCSCFLALIQWFSSCFKVFLLQGIFTHTGLKLNVQKHSEGVSGVL